MKTINDYAPHQHKLIINDPHGDPTEGHVTLTGRYSDEFYNAARDTLRDKNIFDQTLTVLEEENIHTIAACVKDWNEKFWLSPCTQENVEALLRQPKFHFVKEQIEAAVMNKTLFFKKKKVKRSNGSSTT